MRTRRVLELLALLAVVGAIASAAAAYVSFRSALSARLDRAQKLEAAVTRPGAAARLAASLAQRRLAIVTEKQSTAVSAAFRREDGAAALQAYRAAGGDPEVIREAERALSAGKPAGPDGDVPFLRAVRRLDEESARLPAPSRPAPPASAAAAGRRLLWAGAALIGAVLLAYAGGRAA